MNNFINLFKMQQDNTDNIKITLHRLTYTIEIISMLKKSLYIQKSYSLTFSENCEIIISQFNGYEFVRFIETYKENVPEQKEEKIQIISELIKEANSVLDSILNDNSCIDSHYLHRKLLNKSIQIAKEGKNAYGESMEQIIDCLLEKWCDIFSFMNDVKVTSTVSKIKFSIPLLIKRLRSENRNEFIKTQFDSYDKFIDALIEAF